MHLLCSQLLKSLIDLPLESKGRGQDPKSDLGFSEIVKNVNNLHLFLWGISVAMMVCFQLSLFHYIDVLYKIQDSILLFFAHSFFLSPHQNNNMKKSIPFHTVGDQADELNVHVFTNLQNFYKFLHFYKAAFPPFPSSSRQGLHIIPVFN